MSSKVFKENKVVKTNNVFKQLQKLSQSILALTSVRHAYTAEMDFACAHFQKKTIESLYFWQSDINMISYLAGQKYNLASQYNLSLTCCILAKRLKCILRIEINGSI